MAHALLAPSAAVRWMACAGSIHFTKDIPAKSSPFAEEGTRAHEQAERAVRAIFQGEKYEPTTGDVDMARHAAAWAQVLLSHFGGNESALRFWDAERKLNVGCITGGMNDTGTADFMAITENGTLLIADFKYGMGVPVSVERNPQLSIYALAALEEFSFIFDINRVELLIYQPRLNERPDVFEWDLFDLRQWGKMAIRAARKARDIKDDVNAATQALNPGEAQCKFCPAKGLCPALRSKTQEVVGAQFDVVEQVQQPALPATPEQLSRALPWLETIESWCDAVRARAMETIQRGESVPGYKIVAGRKGARKWLPEAEARLKAMRLKSAVLYEKTLISPTKAERAMKEGVIGPRQWNDLQSLMVQAEGKPALVPESDKRPAINYSVADQFEIIEG